MTESEIKKKLELLVIAQTYVNSEDELKLLLMTKKIDLDKYTGIKAILKQVNEGATFEEINSDMQAQLLQIQTEKQNKINAQKAALDKKAGSILNATDGALKSVTQIKISKKKIAAFISLFIFIIVAIVGFLYAQANILGFTTIDVTEFAYPIYNKSSYESTSANMHYTFYNYKGTDSTFYTDQINSALETTQYTEEQLVAMVPTYDQQTADKLTALNFQTVKSTESELTEGESVSFNITYDEALAKQSKIKITGIDSELPEFTTEITGLKMPADISLINFDDYFSVEKNSTALNYELFDTELPDPDYERNAVITPGTKYYEVVSDEYTTDPNQKGTKAIMEYKYSYDRYSGKRDTSPTEYEGTVYCETSLPFQQQDGVVIANEEVQVVCDTSTSYYSPESEGWNKVQ